MSGRMSLVPLDLAVLLRATSEFLCEDPTVEASREAAQKTNQKEEHLTKYSGCQEISRLSFLFSQKLLL